MQVHMYVKQTDLLSFLQIMNDIRSLHVMVKLIILHVQEVVTYFIYNKLYKMDNFFLNSR